MRIFIAGATGAVGIRVVRLLAAAGHCVVGTTVHSSWREGFANSI